MRRPKILHLLPFLAAGCTGYHEAEKPEDAEEPSEPIAVRVAPVRTASFRKTVKAIGIVRPIPAGLVQVSAVVEGMVAEILAGEGDPVKAGQPIIRLDDRLARLDLDEKKAARTEAEASLALLKALPREPDRRAADLEIARAKVDLEIAKAAADRLKPLHDRKEVSDPQLYEAEQKAEEASLALKAAEARRDILIQGPRPEAVAEGEGKVARAKAAEEAAWTRIGLLVLSSPRGGVLSKVLCHPGQMLAAGAVAAEVLDAAQVWITAPVPAAEALEIQTGQTASLSMASAKGTAPGEPAGGAPTAKVAFVGSEASPATGSIPVTILAEGGGLRPGTAVPVEIVVGTVAEALAVPDAALVSSEEGPAIAVVRGEKAEILHPKVGLHDAESRITQIAAEGLRPGDLVVVSGAYNRPEGFKVKIEKPDEAAEKAGAHAGEEGSKR